MLPQAPGIQNRFAVNVAASADLDVPRILSEDERRIELQRLVNLVATAEADPSFGTAVALLLHKLGGHDQ